MSKPRVSEMEDPVIMQDGGGLYWREDACGYTSDPLTAGIYERSKVIGYTGRSYADKRITLHPVPELHQRVLVEKLEDAQKLIMKLEAQVSAMECAIERDRTKIADAVTELRKELDSRYWLTEGRGSYEWNDDRYQAEFLDAGRSLIEKMKPLQQIAQDLSNSPVRGEDVRAARIDVEKRITELEADAERYRAINTPEVLDFITATHNEALHQRDRWGSTHDEGKQASDWFWLVGYLAGKALNSSKAGDQNKYLHHIVTCAAALCNWHAAVLGATNMRPGIADPAIAAQRQEEGK